MRSTFQSLLLFGPLFCGALLTGCASAKGKKNAPKPEAASAEPVQKTAEPARPWRQSLGRVVLVNEAMAFVLIEIGAAAAPEAGSPLQSYSDSAPSADLVVSNYQRSPFLIADIVSGMPKVGDSIVAGGRRAAAESSSGASPRETPTPRRFAPEPLPRVDSGTEFLRRAPADDASSSSAPAPKLEPAPKPETVAPVSEPAAPSGVGIIPGLPAVRKKPSQP